MITILTPTVLGAVTLGAKVIENTYLIKWYDGPDHKFSMTPNLKEMIDRSKALELSLGDGIKKIEDNETETVVAKEIDKSQ